MPRPVITNSLVFISSGLNNGGAELALERLLKGLIKKNTFRLAVISLDSVGPVGIRIREMGVTVIALNLRNRSFLVSFAHFVSQIKKLQPIEIHGWMYHGNVFAFLAWVFQPNSQLVFNIRQALHSLCQEKLSTRITILFNALFSRVCHLVIHNSTLGIKHHEKLGFGSSNSLYIPNGFDLIKLSPCSDKRESFRTLHKIPRQSRVICLLARYDPIKGHNVFLEGAKILLKERPDTIFLMVGEGLSSDHPKLSSLINSIKSNVIALGHQDEISSVLNGSDILTVCSHSEGFPNSLGEAMSVGLVCVATDVGGCAKILGDCGRLIPPNEPDLLAKSWLDLLSLPNEEFLRVGLKARQRIKDCFSVDKFVNSYLNILSTSNS
jgi:glycosyltransferase involved in cell wall biosynthesis